MHVRRTVAQRECCASLTLRGCGGQHGALELVQLLPATGQEVKVSDAGCKGLDRKSGACELLGGTTTQRTPARRPGGSSSQRCPVRSAEPP
eukprot:SAG31_NODE_1755_length_7344_cov_7.207039_1_plen_91_part_00